MFRNGNTQSSCHSNITDWESEVGFIWKAYCQHAGINARKVFWFKDEA